jgi:hypothetical protein
MGRTIDTHPTLQRVTPKRAHLQVFYGASRDRTGDLLLAKQALSQLSYGPPNRV